MEQSLHSLFEMLRYHCENEVVEFKKAENGFDFDDLGKYFSALSNEANLRKKDFAWLVFGVHDKSREVVGTTYKNGAKSLQKLKHDFTEQRKRFFPMPDFHIDEEKREVAVKIYGRIIDERYYRLLKANPDLSLGDCIALDAVQKHEVIGKEEVSRLRKLHLIEGRYPNLFLSEYAAKTSDNNELKMEYIKNKSFNDQHFKKMIVSYLRSFGGATRAELNTLLQSKLSDVLSDEQKIRKIGNLLSGLKKEGIIRLSEKKKWILVEV